MSINLAKTLAGELPVMWKEKSPNNITWTKPKQRQKTESKHR